MSRFKALAVIIAIVACLGAMLAWIFLYSKEIVRAPSVSLPYRPGPAALERKAMLETLSPGSELEPVEKESELAGMMRVLGR